MDLAEEALPRRSLELPQQGELDLARQALAKLLFEFLKEPTRDGWLRIQRDVRALKGSLDDSEKRPPA